MAANFVSVSAVDIYAQQYLPNATSPTIPTGMETDGYGAPGKILSDGHKILLLPQNKYAFPEDGDWVVWYSSTTTTYRFVVDDVTFAALTNAV